MFSCSAAISVGTNCTGSTIARANRRLHDVLGFRVADLLFGERLHFAEGEREIEWRVVHRAEIGISARLGAGVFGDDGEVDLFAVGHGMGRP